MLIYVYCKYLIQIKFYINEKKKKKILINLKYNFYYHV